MVKNLLVINNGQLDIDQSLLVSGKGAGKILRVPVYSVLLETEKGYVLIDTGLNPDGLGDPEKTWGERVKTIPPIMYPEDDIRRGLERINVNTNEVKYVINTHLHWDHTGGNRFFKNAVFFVQKSEYRFAMYPDHHLRLSYMKNHFDVDVNYQLIEGDYELLPGVMIIHTPGHTPGHQSILITLNDSRKFIVGGDAVYTWENFDHVIPPGNCWSSYESILSLHRIITIQRLTGAFLLPSHDSNFWEKYNKFIGLTQELEV